MIICEVSDDDDDNGDEHLLGTVQEARAFLDDSHEEVQNNTLGI